MSLLRCVFAPGYVILGVLAVTKSPSGTERRLSAGVVRVRRGGIFVQQDTLGRALQVFVLMAAQGPQKRDQPGTCKHQGHRNKDKQHVHQRTRNAFSNTVIDDNDIAIAAPNGVANPRIAIGTATTL